MNQFLGSIIITVCILFCFFFGIRYIALWGMDPVEIVEFQDRYRIVFVEDEENQDKHFPYILEAIIEEENIDSIILDVMYYVPENDDLIYVLSVRPERSDFKVDEKTLKPGLGAERVTVFFNPNSMFKRRVTTEYLKFYIDAYGESEIDKTFLRKASFLKAWRKQQYRGIFLRRSVFHTE